MVQLLFSEVLNFEKLHAPVIALALLQKLQVHNRVGYVKGRKVI